MAKMEYVHPAHDDFPEQVSCIEVRAWGLAGREDQVYYIGSGVNYHANDNVWIEFCYSIQGAQVFYTRTSFQCIGGVGDAESFKARLDEALQTGNGSIVFGGGYIPGSFISFDIETKTYENENGIPTDYTYHRLIFSFDTGVIFGRGSPGGHSIEMKIPDVEPEEATQFMMDLFHDIDDAYHGKHPDPVSTPPGRSEWPLIRQLNGPAYDLVSQDYYEDYFANPHLAAAFDGWLAQLPSGGRVLDAGCGHGRPVISRLLEKGFQAAGTDFSPAMLVKARENFPQLDFWNKTTSEIDFEGEFDGICSFHSALYLDPIDFFHSIYRFYHALKPGGLLFLFGYDGHPGWRGEPFYMVVGHWMWSDTYSMDEACHALQEHGYFEVLDARDVTTEEERVERRARLKAEKEKERAELEARRKSFEEDAQAKANLEEPAQPEEHVGEEPAVEAAALQNPAEEMPAIALPEEAQAALQALLGGENGQPDFSKIQLPPFPEPNDTLPYLYVVVARRKG